MKDGKEYAMKRINKDILIEKRCSLDRRYYEYKFNEIEQWKE
jgi:hypothetical protein